MKAYTVTGNTGMMGKRRQAVYDKYQGRCAYSGTDLEDNWQIDHVVPRVKGGTSEIENLLPAQRIINHYKRALDLETFRTWFLGGLHIRLGKLPKNPRTEQSFKKNAYLRKVAGLFGIDEQHPFTGKFYFEENDMMGKKEEV